MPAALREVAFKAMPLASRASYPLPSAHPSSVSNLYIAHGFLGNANNWATAARRLLEHPELKRRVRAAYTLDMRNHGKSPHSATHTNADMAADLEGVILRGQRDQAQVLKGNETMRTAAPLNDRGHSVLIGHSMGGLALAGLMLRRYNEEALLSMDLSGNAAQDWGEWELEQRRRNSASMRAVNAEFGFSATQPIRDVLFYDPHAPPLGQTGEILSHVPQFGRVSACVIVDVTPTLPLGPKRAGGDSVYDVLERIGKVNLSAVQSYSEVDKELIRVGIDDKSMRDFVATNIILHEKAASWRCNLRTLTNDYEKIRPDIVNWFKTNSMHDSVSTGDTNAMCPHPCTLPVLFVFGGDSPYNHLALRTELKRYFTNAQEVVIEGAGHYVHYEKTEAFVKVVAPFIAEHLGGRHVE